MCSLHREVLNTKMEACDRRVDGILDEIKEVRQLQKNIQWTLLFIAIGVGYTLIGVILGRGFDFGWVIP
jgi:hypothetical protein